MSKLFKLKEWLTIEETSKHLSSMLGEEVDIANVYRFALDGYLVMSMYFPNKAYGNLGCVVGVENTKRLKAEGKKLDLILESNLDIPDGEIIVSDYIGDDKFVNWDETVASIDGVWDLSMLASERIDVEHVYQQHIGGPAIELTNLNGTFLRRGDIFCRLVESMDNNPYQTGSTAARKKIESYLLQNEVSAERKSQIWEQYDKERKEYLNNKREAPFERDFYPAGGLPTDGVYVVRTAAIVDFLNRINETPKEEKPLYSKERNSLLVLIAALCKEANFNIEQRGTATALTASTEKLGRPLTDDTIRAIIKQIRSLLS